ncbi:MAG: ribosome silencing factor [Patescibacteria group bacterium]
MGIELLHAAVEAVMEKKAIEPLVLGLAKLTALIDYFLICSAQRPLQVKAIADRLKEVMDDAGQTLLHAEGDPEAGWVLLDYGWLVAHIMLHEQREFYQLERLWHDAERIEAGVSSLE